MARGIDLEHQGDLIAAPATAPGAAAIAIVRMSGAGAIDAAEKIFHSSPSLDKAEPGRMKLGYIHNKGRNIDHALAVRWMAPRSYTGEDMAEFHCHGSPEIVREVMEACLATGARAAQPGEFTRRAYLNGKMDLAQAEAVARLSSSQTEAARRAAMMQLQGGLSDKLLTIRQNLVRVAAELEAGVDYPEEDLPATDRTRLTRLVRDARHGLDELIESHSLGQRLAEGATVVFAGPPNAGKSSLFNALLRRERAIVTPHAGTTRDSIEAAVDLRGIPVTLIDTAGLRPNPEEIEALGIEKTRELIRAADLTLFVIDSADCDTAAWGREYQEIRDLPHIVLFNKSDLGNGLDTASQELFANSQAIPVSARSPETIGALEDAIRARLAPADGGETSGVVLTSQRHRDALQKAWETLRTVMEGIAADLAAEFVVIDLTLALSQIDLVTGKRSLDEDVLDEIFSTFCLGK